MIPPPSSTGSRLTLLALAAASAVVAACSSGASIPGATDGDSPTTATLPADGQQGGPAGEQAALEQAARDSFEAFLSGDDDAYFAALSSECRERLGHAAVESYLSGRRFNAVNVGNVDLQNVTIAGVEISDFDGRSGDATLVLTGTSEAFRESLPHLWTFEDGAWRLADCDEIRESQNTFEDRGTDRGAPLHVGEIADIGGWILALSHVNQDFEAVMSPGEVEPAGSGNKLVSAQLQATYNGAEPSVVIGDHLAFDLVSASGVYGSEAAFVSDLEGLFYDPTMEATPGENLPRPLICREVPETETTTMLLRATHIPTGAEYWFDLSAAP